MPAKLSQDKVDRIFALLETKREDGKPVPLAAIASEIGCSEVTIRHYRDGRRKRFDLWPEKAEKIRRMYADGQPLQEIIRKCRTSMATVRKVVKDLPQRKRKPQLSEEQKAGLRRMYVEGDKISVIAATFGISDWTVMAHTKGLPRRENRKSFIMVNMHRCVIVEIAGENNPYMVQPTGRLDYCTSALAPDRQWHMEVVDTRDGRIKHIPIADISRWATPLAGSPVGPIANNLQKTA